MRLALVLCVVALGAAVPAGAESPVRVTLTTNSTKPVAGTPWRYTIAARDRAGQPVAAKVRFQVVRGTRVVRCWKRTAIVRCSGATAGTWISFRGRRAATIRWPLSLAGVRLAFRATVVTGTHSLRLRAPLIVRRP